VALNDWRPDGNQDRA